MQARTNLRLRQIHRYLGVFFAPAILFFAFSGMLQTFSFHEAKGYGGKPPPGWIAYIASVHKDQVVPRPKAAAAGGDDDHDHRRPAAADHDHDHDTHDSSAPSGQAPARSALPLKTFVGIMSIGLILSSLLGIALAIGQRGTRRGALVALAAGSILPVVLLLA